MKLFKSPFKLHIFLSLLIAFSGNAAASSCVITEKMVLDWNEKYKKQIKINSRKIKENEYTVEILFPKILNGKIFDNIWLFKAKPVYDAAKMNHDFAIPLGAWEAEDVNNMEVFYNIKSFLAMDNYISISYGNGCDMHIHYPVYFIE